MSINNPNYLDLDTIKDDYVRRKVDEHYRIDRLAKSNPDVLDYDVLARDKLKPFPPTQYLIRYHVKSFIGVQDGETPVVGTSHEMVMTIPRYFPEQTVECKMKSQTWHPNIKSSGPFFGDMCTNHKGFGGLYTLDELIVRVGEMLQYKRYLAEDVKPWPEDPEVARWVKKVAEPKGIVDKEKGIFADDYAWVVHYDDIDEYEGKLTALSEVIVFSERTTEGGEPSGVEGAPEQATPANDDEILFS